MRDETLENVLRMLDALTEELNKEREKQKESENQKTTLDSLNRRVTYMERSMNDMKEEYDISTGKIERFASELSNTVRELVESAIFNHARKILKNQTDEVVERVVEIVHSTYELSQEIKGKEVAKEFISSRLSLPPQRRKDPRYYPLTWHQAKIEKKEKEYALQQLATPLEVERGVSGDYGRCRVLTKKGYRCQHRSPLTKVPTGHLLPQHYVRLEKYICPSHDTFLNTFGDEVKNLMREKLDEVFGVD